MDVMKEIKGAMGVLGGMAKGAIAFDATAAGAPRLRQTKQIQSQKPCRQFGKIGIGACHKKFRM